MFKCQRMWGKHSQNRQLFSSGSGGCILFSHHAPSFDNWDNETYQSRNPTGKDWGHKTMRMPAQTLAKPRRLYGMSMIAQLQYKEHCLPFYLKMSLNRRTAMLYLKQRCTDVGLGSSFTVWSQPSWVATHKQPLDVGDRQLCPVKRQNDCVKKSAILIKSELAQRQPQLIALPQKSAEHLRVKKVGYLEWRLACVVGGWGGAGGKEGRLVALGVWGGGQGGRELLLS